MTTIEVTVARDVYFVEEQRWPSRSQRFSWLVAIGIVIFIIFELKMLVVEPLIASGILLVLLAAFLIAITVQQRLSVRIGRNLDARPGQVVVRRFWQRAVQAVPVRIEGDNPAPTQPALRISYVAKGPLWALSSRRRGSRLGRRERHIPLQDIESWSECRLSRFIWLRRARESVFPVGAQRDAVTMVLTSGESVDGTHPDSSDLH